MGYIVTIFNGILSALGFITKNPIVQKIATFSFFFGLVSFVVDFFIGKASSSLINASSLLSIASYLGLLNAIKIILNFVIAGFIAKQILAFIRS